MILYCRLYVTLYIFLSNFIEMFIYHTIQSFNLQFNGPGWCGSVGWVSSCKPKGLRVESHWGHISGFWAQSPVVQEAADRCLSLRLMFLFLSFSLPSPPSRISKRKRSVKTPHYNLMGFRTFTDMWNHQHVNFRTSHHLKKALCPLPYTPRGASSLLVSLQICLCWTFSVRRILRGPFSLASFT